MTANTIQFDFSEASLDTLREEIREGLSEYRFRHIAEVERMIVRLGELYLPNDLPMLRAAALLHDLTKEFSNEKHEKILASHGILLTDADRLSPKLYHAVTASLLIPEEQPRFAHPSVVSAVRYHTEGHADMTLFSLLLYLADYIDESRTFPDCVALREYFWGSSPERMSDEERLAHLYATVIRSVDLTVTSLIGESVPISPRSIEMRNALIARLRQ